MRKFLVVLASGIVLVVVVFGFFLVFEHVRGGRQLARYRGVLREKGEKLDAADLALPNGGDRNGAPGLWGAAEGLETNEVWQHVPGAMRLQEDGSAEARFRLEKWKEGQETFGWEGLAAALEADSGGMAAVRKALEASFFDNDLDYSAGPELLLPHLEHGRKLAERFGVASQLALRRGATGEAAQQLVAQARLARALENDRLLISELVRIAVAGIARSYAWEALQADGWEDGELALLAKAWQETEFVRGLARALEGERVYVAETYRQMRESNAKAAEILFWMEDSGFNLGFTEEPATSWWSRPGAFQGVRRFLRNEVYCRVWRFAWLDQSHALYMECIQELLEGVRMAVAHRSYKELRADADRIYDQAAPKSFYGKLRAPTQTWLGVVITSTKRPMRMETERSLVLAAIAVKRYTLRHGKPPVSLGLLVPELLEAVPIDFMDGRPIRFRVVEGVPVLYSVGEDGVDDGGDTAVGSEESGKRTIWDRRDVVWPVEVRVEG